MEQKVTILLKDEGFEIESDLAEADLIVLLEHVKFDLLIKMRGGL
jgi:hypothetical protein